MKLEDFWAYELRAGEYLTGGERVFLWRLVRVFVGDLAEAGHAAGQLTLLQGQQVAAVQAVHGAPSHPPVEVVHGLSLQRSKRLSYSAPRRKAQTHACTRTANTFTEPWRAGLGGAVFSSQKN